MGLLENIFGKQYSWYDSPDGEDCLKKLGCVTQFCGIYGVLLSSADVMLISHPKGYPQIFARYAYITLPLMGMGAAFASTTCIATNMRQKDDIWNYFLGGVATGAVAGAWKKSLKVGTYAALALGAVAALKKDVDMKGWEVLGLETHPKSANHRRIHRDFSFTSDPGKA